MPALVRAELAFIPSFLEALGEGFSRDNLRPTSPEEIAQIERQPEWFVRIVNNPPRQVVLPDGTLGQRVPATELWYMDGATFLGSVGIRHELNAILESWGGHIGYAVRPSARRQGHASAMLAEALDHVRATLPLSRVMLTVDLDNTASIKVIEKNGGTIRDEVDNPWVEGVRGRRYWIDLR
ncbi:GNAT family N-acetyltransferase [Phenylobacterium sp.]|jgi:predicted acetyltransferase|uniref:GNAT family N-acetyltransferase n=1 Tax=Phenylobacterium sp. TaxID=1871053 RepID=UPI002F41DA7F